MADVTNGRPMTVGEYRVGVDFNPSGNQVVTDLKAKAAAFIDAVDAIASDRTSDLGNEVGRLKALAITHAEDAAMWAVNGHNSRADNGKGVVGAWVDKDGTRSSIAVPKT